MSEQGKKYWTDDPELVERYILGKLSPEEMERLDREIAGCEPCKAIIAREAEIAAGIRRHGRDRMKADLRKKLRRDRASQFYSYQYIGLAAAVVVIAIGIGLYQIWFSDLVAPKQFQHPQIIITSKPDTSGNIREQQNDAERDSKQIAEGSAVQKKSERREGIRIERQSASQKFAERTVEPTVSGNAPAKNDHPSVADGGSVAVSEALPENHSAAVWLIGNVVMIGERAGSSMEKSSRSSSSGEMTAVKKSSDGKVIVRHRAVKELPSDRAAASRASGQIETLLERNDDKLVLTLFDDSVNESDVQQAVIESLSDDLLVVALPNQRITYHLPSGWNQSSRSR